MIKFYNFPSFRDEHKKRNISRHYCYCLFQGLFLITQTLKMQGANSFENLITVY